MKRIDIKDKNNTTIIIESNKKFDDISKHLFKNLFLEEINYRNHSDVIFIENTEGSIKSETVRGFIKSLQLKPISLTYLLGIINDAETLTREAQNILLKTLEEPNPNTQIILITKNVNSLLPTVRSRSIIFQSQFQKEQKSRILSGNLVEDLEKVDEILLTKNKKEKETKIENLFLSIIEDLKLKAKNNPKLYENLKEILKLSKLVKANVNLRLVLEYTIIYLNRIK